MSKHSFTIQARIIAALCVVFTFLAFSNIRFLHDHIPGMKWIPPIIEWSPHHGLSHPPIAGKKPNDRRGNNSKNSSHKHTVANGKTNKSHTGVEGNSSPSHHSSVQTPSSHTVAGGRHATSGGHTGTGSSGSQSNGGGSNGGSSGGQSGTGGGSSPATPSGLHVGLTAGPLSTNVGVNRNGVNLNVKATPLVSVNVGLDKQSQDVDNR